MIVPVVLLLLLFDIVSSQEKQKACIIEGTIGDSQCLKGFNLEFESRALALVFDCPQDETNIVAIGILEDRRNSSGWDELTMTTTLTDDLEKRFVIGVLEGFLTQHRIADFARNIKSLRSAKLLDKTMEYVETWQTKIEEKVLENHDDPLWHSVSLVLARLDGLYHGLTCSTSMKITREDLLLIQYDGDVIDIENLLDYISKKETSSQFLQSLSHKLKQKLIADGSSRANQNDEEFWSSLMKNSRCSALIRMTDDGEILVGHATWASFAEMIRVYKNIDYGNIKVSYSSFAGMISSSDDFYVTSNGLSIMETSLNILDSKSYAEIEQQLYQGLPTWIRAIVATEEAKTGVEWVDIFSREFSGTYNCQWMILDRKQKNKTSGLLHVYESMPFVQHHEDLTLKLVEDRFFSSQNTPLFEEVRAAGFYPTNSQQLKRGICKTCKCLYSYSDNPRGCIFKRDAPKVQNIEDMKALMRSNQWKTDPLSMHSPDHAIAGRYDLKSLRPSTLGAIDAKVFSLFADSSFSSVEVIGGLAVNDQCPIFNNWALFGEVSHTGITGLSGNENWFRTSRLVL